MKSVDIYTQKQKLKDDFIRATRKNFVGVSMPHGHEFFEIELILGGTGTYVIDGIHYPIEPNMLFFMTPAQIHSVNDANSEIINVMFQCEGDIELLSFPILNDNTLPVYRLTAEETDFLLSLLKEIIAVQKRNTPYAMLLLRCILHKLSEKAPTAKATPPSYVQRAVLYILKNFRTGITLESVSAHLGLSKVYFSEYFSKHMGVNFKTYLDNLRFSYVENLLVFTDLPTNEIYVQAGFVDYPNFARRFKKKNGCTPGEYRKQKKNQL